MYPLLSAAFSSPCSMAHTLLTILLNPPDVASFLINCGISFLAFAGIKRYLFLTTFVHANFPPRTILECVSVSPFSVLTHEPPHPLSTYRHKPGAFHLTYGNHMAEFATMGESFMTLYRFSMGDWDVGQLQSFQVMFVRSFVYYSSNCNPLLRTHPFRLCHITCSFFSSVDASLPLLRYLKMPSLLSKLNPPPIQNPDPQHPKKKTH